MAASNRIVTVCLFTLGFAAETLAFNAYHLWRRAAKPPTRQERYEEAFTQLDLDDAQHVEVRRIVGKTRESLQQLRQKSEP